jgi:thiamine-phosphate pyrophosphorylase
LLFSSSSFTLWLIEKMEHGMRAPFYRLMLLTRNLDSSDFEEEGEIISKCARVGLTAVQLRQKNASWNQAWQMGQRLKALLRPLGIPLIINDRVDLAVALDADGVHLGQSDMHPLAARARLGPDKIIGWSVECMDQVHQANTYGLDYVAASAVFATPHKANLNTTWGLGGLAEVVTYSRHPVVAIGGINATSLPEVLRTGAAGIAVIGALYDAPNPLQACTELRWQINDFFINHPE